jgi:hypothetical protein
LSPYGGAHFSNGVQNKKLHLFGLDVLLQKLPPMRKSTLERTFAFISWS